MRLTYDIPEPVPDAVRALAFYREPHVIEPESIDGRRVCVHDGLPIHPRRGGLRHDAHAIDTAVISAGHIPTGRCGECGAGLGQHLRKADERSPVNHRFIER
jgi:hypothetical protein